MYKKTKCNFGPWQRLASIKCLFVPPLNLTLYTCINPFTTRLKWI